MRLLRALLAAAAWLVAPPAPGKDVNVLVNGGFEKSLDGWLSFDTTQKGRIEIVKEAKEGKKALLLERKGGEGVVMVRQDLAGPPGKDLVLAFSYRSKTGGNAQVAIFGYDGKSDEPVFARDVRLTGPSKNWDRKDLSVELPDTIAKVSIAIRAFQDGEYQFDDVVLTASGGAAAPKPGELLVNGDFERGLVGWELEMLSGRASAEPSAEARHAGAKGLRIERKARCEMPCDSVIADVTPMPKSPLTIQLHARARKATGTVEIRFLDERDVLVKPVVIGKIEKPAWTAIQGKATPPAGAARARLAIVVTGEGSIDLDDVEVK